MKMGTVEDNFEECFKSIKTKLKTLFNCPRDEALIIMDSTTELIFISSKHKKNIRKTVEIFSESVQFIIQSENFRKTFLQSDDQFLKRVSMKLLTTYGVFFDCKFCYDLALDYKQLGHLAIDSFENMFLLISTKEKNPNLPVSHQILTLLFRKLCSSITDQSDYVDFAYLFNIWKICLTTNQKIIRNEFFLEFLDRMQFYSTFIMKSVDIFSDYKSFIETFNVLNCLLTLCLENDMFKLNFDRSKCSKLASFVRKLCTKLDFSRFLCEKCRWFGGICSNPDGDDRCLRRVIILTLIKSEAILINSNSKNCLDRVDFGMDSSCVVDLFLDQDDQFCELLLCNLLLETKSWWNCHEMMFSFLNSVNWSYDILLDWIISEETLFLAYFTRYLKKSICEIRILLDVAKNFEFVEKILPSQSNLELELHEMLSLKVNELVGDVETSKTVIVQPLKKSKGVRLQSNATEKRVKLDVTMQLVKCFDSLKEKLTSLNDKKLSPFNFVPLLNLLSKFLSGMKND